MCAQQTVCELPNAFSSLFTAWSSEPCWRQIWNRLHRGEVWGAVMQSSKTRAGGGRQEWGRHDGGMRQRGRQRRLREKLHVADRVAASLPHIRATGGPQGPGFTLTSLYQPLWAQVQHEISVSRPQGHQAVSWGEAHTQMFVCISEWTFKSFNLCLINYNVIGCPKQRSVYLLHYDFA